MPRAKVIAINLLVDPDDSRDTACAEIVPFPASTLAMTQAAAAGDEAACTQFFNQYCDRLHRYLLVATRGNDDLARELLSLSMIKAVRNMRPLETDLDTWRWLTTIARNAFIDHCRKDKRVITQELPATLANADPDQTLTHALNESVQELPFEDREVLERFYYEDQSQLALAAEAHTSRKAIESRLARIRQKLRASILKKLS